VILTSLDLLGTLVFAFSGSLVAARRGLDIVGFFVLALAAGTAGGVLRDVLLGATPPAALTDWRYAAVCAVAALFVFVFGTQAIRIEPPSACSTRSASASSRPRARRRASTLAWVGSPRSRLGSSPLSWRHRARPARGARAGGPAHRDLRHRGRGRLACDRHRGRARSEHAGRGAARRARGHRAALDAMRFGWQAPRPR